VRILLLGGRSTSALVLALVLGLSGPGRAFGDFLVTNGGFEAGFASWTKSDEAGGDGTFALQTGKTSPVNGFSVPAPPGGTTAAMTDAAGPGSHVLYQDFLAPTGTKVGFATFSLFLNNTGSDYFNPTTLDFGATNANGTEVINQQVRVDILKAGTNPFSVAPADVLQTLYLSKPGDPLVSGYTNFTSDVSSVLAANAGQTLRLRFSEADNLGPLNLGVDNVGIVSTVPEPSAIVSLAIGGILTIGIAVRRRAC
jgi:hypothetical protein